MRITLFILLRLKYTLLHADTLTGHVIHVTVGDQEEGN
jgi:hypothetical protein